MAAQSLIDRMEMHSVESVRIKTNWRWGGMILEEPGIHLLLSTRIPMAGTPYGVLVRVDGGMLKEQFRRLLGNH